ncbi:MAG: heme lyase CcmF/NrfE family subunit, partial [SAR202 cluster bacterium]|nr:heme lyase CcmF/NrfE family subunit [SAR202 cluster bacterium]
LIFAAVSGLAIWRAPDEVRPALPYTTFVLMSITVFFVAVMMTMANPFFELPVAPADGQGINPLLTHVGMFFHPPMLMAGLIGLGIPFAFGMGHLMAGQTGDEWVDTARVWALSVWAVLTIGLLLGAWWAYTILGWGGYWAWDPVENAGLLPWLPLTAFVHSIMVQRRRGMFRMWNMALIILAWGFAMYGMFMNRGGPVPSVHSFGQSTMGWVFLVFLGVNLLGAFALFFWRYSSLKSAAALESHLSREAAFLLNNLLFLMIALVTLWGVVYPLVTDVFRGVTITVGRPYFDVVAGPLFLALVVLMGVGPLLPWRRASGQSLLRLMRIPIMVGLGTALVSIALGAASFIPALAFGVCGMAAAGIAREWAKGAQVRHNKGENYALAFTRLVSSNRPRYGGYIAHIGIIMVAFAATGSSFYSVQDDFSLLPGERAVLGDYEMEYLGSTTVVKSDRIEQRADVLLYKNGDLIKQLQPGYAFYPSFSMAATRAGIRQTPVEDLYILASEFSEDGRALFRLHINPLIIWLWLAGPVMVFGTVVALWPERQKAAVAISTLRVAPATA